MDQALAAHARGDAHLRKQLDRDLLEHAGANPAFHTLAAALFQDPGSRRRRRCSNCWSSSPAGPAPMIATWVRTWPARLPYSRHFSCMCHKQSGQVGGTPAAGAVAGSDLLVYPPERVEQGLQLFRREA